MTANRNFKRRVRARVTKTGESYAAALRHFRSTAEGDTEMSNAKAMRLAVAQTTGRDDPSRVDELRQGAQEVRRLMRRAREAGARVIQFPEGAICSPHKLVMSIDGPDTVGPSDWDRCDWTVLREELTTTAELAARLNMWTVLGAVHQLTAPTRPYNSLYVISDQGTVVTRYDERLLSNTKISYMYSPGTAPVTFDIDGFRFGCALGMEAHYPEIFGEYERLDVDCVLFSSTGSANPGGPQTFVTEVQGYAAAHSYWVGFSVHAQQSPMAPAGVVAPGGTWVARCPAEETPAVVVVDLDDNDSEDIAGALQRSRPWRRKARAGLYDPHFVRDDPRSANRSSF
jgi:predicted amidohydrolase